MPNFTWMTRYPELYRKEREQVEKRFPNLKICDSALENGFLVYHGEIDVRLSSGTSRRKIFLKYPDIYPFHVPHVTPLISLPENEPHEIQLKYELISARHQMNDGTLCLVERNPFGESGIIRGIDVLKRVSQWFFSVESGHNPYDSLEADLQSHLKKAGNILLGPEFYSDELKAGGYFYASPYPISGVNSFRLLGLAFSSDFDTIAQFKDCRSTLRIPFPWINNEIWNIIEQYNNNPNSFSDFINDGSLIKGVWWDLEDEPLPPRRGEDILKLVCNSNNAYELEKVVSYFGTDVLTETNLYVGLRYPSRKDGFDWLICQLPLRPERENTPVIIDKFEKFKGTSVNSLYVHPLKPKELLLRNQGCVPNKISESKISIFGVGAIGSTVADLLAKAGVKRLNLFDFDLLQVGNVIRHQSGIEYFGEPKVSTTLWNLAQHNPFTEVFPYSVNLLESYQRIEESLSECDFVISSTADEPLETAINEVAVSAMKTIYYVRAMRGGSVGRIFRVIPGRDACRYCLSKYLNESDSEYKNWLEIPELENTILSYECGNPILAASGIDLTFISTLCSKLVVEDIAKDFGDKNHWLWSNEIIENHPELNEPYKMVGKFLPPLPDCQFCSEPNITSLEISSQIQNKIEQLVIEAKDNETGGILIGYFENGKAIVTNASDAGPKSITTPIKFIKDTEYTQKWLVDEIKKSQRLIEYIGEWHSHTNGRTSPSTIDIDSLQGITIAENYLCQTPVMIILGKQGQEIVEKSAYLFMLNRPFQKIDYNCI